MTDDQLKELLETPVRVFGVWDAPMTDGGVPIPVPLELKCTYCTEQFVDGDNGAIMPTGFAQHRECGLRGVMGGIGHQVNHSMYCIAAGDPDAGLSFRQSAILVWRLMVQHRPVTPTTIEHVRAGGTLD